ncbi:MAG: glycosyltransferase [Lentisphaeria bacterium]|nr:glycosyltransferase [Lentisphaeria bacterium]
MTRFSLILCTVNRTQEVREYFESLARQQEAPSFEVILIDQNPDERLVPIVEDFRYQFPIRRYTAKPGLSRARNIGLSYAEGEILAFPDDDCTYPELLLKNVSDFLRQEMVDGISTLVTDKQGRLSGTVMYRTARRITESNVWRCGVSISIFVKRQAVGSVLFDEELGVGSGTIYGSGEETDFLLNLIHAGRRLDYCPHLVVNHPVFTGPWTVKRGYLYGCGMGRVLHKHHYTIFRMIYSAGLQVVRAIAALLTLNLPRMCFHFTMAYGRVSGYLRSMSRPS